MSHSIPAEIASTIQSASIQHNPDVRHDLNPSTAASRKEPVSVSRSATEQLEEIEEYSIDGDEEEDDIPESFLRPLPRRPHMPPLPDLRFEQSYLASIEDADSNWKIAWITIRDQLFFPLLQGTLWNLAQIGWRHWNATANYSGTTVGSRIRRWWYKTNNWALPNLKKNRNGFSRVLRDKKLADEISEFNHRFQHPGSS